MSESRPQATRTPSLPTARTRPGDPSLPVASAMRALQVLMACAPWRVQAPGNGSNARMRRSSTAASSRQSSWASSRLTLLA